MSRAPALASREASQQDATTAYQWDNVKGNNMRRELLALLATRRKEQVPLVVTARPERHNVKLQRDISMQRPQLDASYSARWPHPGGELQPEHFVYTSEGGPQGTVPLLIIRPAGGSECSPAVIFLHSTGRSKEMMIPHMQAYAARGYLTAAIDSRYHGERAQTPSSYSDALVEAWEAGEEMPFVLDTVWDIMKLMDHLTSRADVDPRRVGIMGVSLGGMHAWMAAAADTRIAACVPLIGVQSFGWAVANDKWHARVASIPHVFEAAAKDLGKPAVDSHTVACVWQRLAPGLMDALDAPASLPSIAPRPLLVLNGADDARCPLAGLTACITETERRYLAAGVSRHFRFVAEDGVGHATTLNMESAAAAWFDTFLTPSKI
eukprot:jgi/Mesen1/7290/ME000373S06363